MFSPGPEEPDDSTNIATIEPLATPTETVPAVADSFITIIEPRTGAIVDISQPVAVAGRGGGLPEGNVVVQALDPDGNVLAEQAAIIDAPDAGTGGEGLSFLTQRTQSPTELRIREQRRRALPVACAGFNGGRRRENRCEHADHSSL